MKLYFLLLTILLLSCQKEGNDTLLSKQIVGRWQMTSYGGGFDGRVYQASPDSVIIEFKTDKTYKRLVKGHIDKTGKYQLGEVQSIYTGKTDNAVKFDNVDTWSIITIKGNILDISLNAYDGAGASYIKK